MVQGWSRDGLDDGWRVHGWWLEAGWNKVLVDCCGWRIHDGDAWYVVDGSW